mgnify:CR=1 FL=1
MRLLVLSDLHISGDQDPLYASLLRVLNENATRGDTVILAGDIFDLFVGNKKLFRERYSEFFASITRLVHQGVDLRYIEGNHDFLLGDALAASGAQWNSMEFSLEMAGKKIYVAHGDLVDKSDWGYLLLRSFYRSLPFRAFVRLMPGPFIDRLGKTLSQLSRGRKPLLSQELPIEKRERLRRIYRSFAADQISRGFDFVVLGHCHDLDEMSFLVDGRRGHYANMGYPRAHGSYLIWSPGDAKIERTALPATS